MRNEYARTVNDFIARRTRFLFTDVDATLMAVPRVVELMGDELGWDAKRRAKELADANAFCATFKCAPPARSQQVASAAA